MEAKSICVFIVEDSQLILEALVSMIGGIAGAELAGSSSHAAEAIRQIEQTDPDIAILDIRLATGTGFDVLRAVRSEARTRPLVIVFSNYVPEIFQQQCRALGADYIFRKSDEFNQLENLLRSLAKASR